VVDARRCCGESGTLGITRPDIATQVRFRKEEELRKDEATLRAMTKAPAGTDIALALGAVGTDTAIGAVGVDAAMGAVGAKGNIKILTSCPSCLQGLSRYTGDLANGLLEADYIVVEMARRILGPDWMPEYVSRANAGGIERVLV
jgi:Fe-S oxidoreductase